MSGFSMQRRLSVAGLSRGITTQYRPLEWHETIEMIRLLLVSNEEKGNVREVCQSPEREAMLRPYLIRSDTLQSH